MAWTSLSTRISSLPLVLAGPIVRKTTRTSISVWIALKEAQTLELVIKSDPNQSSTILGRADTKAFGKNLHIALITVSGLNLLPNTIYYYDINFSGSRTLVSQGILESSGVVAKIVYNNQLLPSFILPSDNMSKLKIVHASCRKPHGGVDGDKGKGKDAFEAVSILLNNTHNVLDQRPQQLYLTGDQIYADDVADLLLFMLRDAQNALLGWGNNTELLPSNPSSESLLPLHRLPLVRAAGFSSGDDVCKSHLLKLGEFYSMYLFVWSDILWPDKDDLPPFSEYEGYAKDDISFIDYGHKMYKEKKEKLLDFKESLTHVRKALANISTYMIFDDHEITDDWFISKPWTFGVYASPLGRRIIQNGLSAYAVFQGWGNKPEQFSNTATDEYKLLNALVTLNTEHQKPSPPNVSQWNDIDHIVLPKLFEQPTSTESNLTGGIDWSYSMSFDKFNVIVLNSRTNRTLFNAKPRISSLLGTAALQCQITNRVLEKQPRHEFTLIIAPAPVFGLPLMEELIQPIITSVTKSPTSGDYETWSASRNNFEQFLSEISKFKRVLLLSGDVHYAFSNSVDYWDKRTSTVLRSKFVNLISSSLKNSTKGAPEGTTFLAAAINNHIPEILDIENDGLYVCWKETSNTTSPGSIIVDALVIQNSIYSFTGHTTISVNGDGNIHWHHLRPYRSKSTVEIMPNKIPWKETTEYRQWVDLRFPPDWEYKIVFESDLRKGMDRMAEPIPPPSSTIEAINTATMHILATLSRDNHTIVGDNNIGEITFQWGNNEQGKKVVHKIWSRVGNTFKPFTIHVVDFGIAEATDQRPSEIGRVP